ncbi:MAG: SulP family inorganic anion transporter [Planctomycetota bacterium]
MPGLSPGASREGAVRDLLAGLITAAVVIPKAMAYATIAGLPVQVGLYTAFVPMVVYALLGTSRPLSVSTTTTIAILSATVLGQVAPSGDPEVLARATATLTLLVGGALVLAALLRLGFVANFISEPVLCGFKAGIAAVIVVDQAPTLLGVHLDKAGFVHNVAEILRAVPSASLPATAVAAASILGLLALERYAPRLPAPLIVIAAAMAGHAMLGLGALGVESIGTVPAGLPATTVPDLDLVGSLWPAALGIALMSFTETIAAGRAFAVEGEPRLRPDRELLATGLGNACGAMLGAMPSGGGTSQTAVNRLAGARTRLAGLVTAGVALATMLLLAPLFSRMPQATLAAVVVVYSLGLFKPSEFRAILAIRKTEFVWALVAMAGVVLLGTLPGILVAIIVSVIALAYQVADPPIHVLGRKPGTNVFRPRTSEHPEDETFPGLLMLGFEGRLFFANAERLGEKVRPMIEAANPEVVALDLGGVFDLEYTALKMLIAAEGRYRKRGIELWLVGLNQQVLGVVQRSVLGAILGRERMHFTMDRAVERFLSTRGTG